MNGHMMPPPPPPPPGFQGRPLGQQQQQQQQQRPQGPQEHFMPMPMRHPLQQSSQIQDITPHKILDNAACLKMLTSYAAYTIRKDPPHEPRDKPTWARASVTEEHFLKEEIIRQIKKLEKESKRTVADKKIALGPFQQGQITTLLDKLASKEHDMNFEWSLVQLDLKTKPINNSIRGTSKKSLYETVTMTVYLKRAPIGDMNPIQLYQNIERMKVERLRPPPPPPPPQQQNQNQQHQQQHQQQHHHQGLTQQPRPQQQQGGGGQGGNQQQGPIRIPGPSGGIIQLPNNGPQGGNPRPQVMKQQQHPQQKQKKIRAPRKYHRKHNDSSDSSSGSDSGSSRSGSESSDDDSSMTSASSRSYRKHSKGPSQKRSFRRESNPRPYFEARASSPPRHRARDDYGGIPIQRHPYAPDVPHAAPGVDLITSAYQAGKQDAIAERFGDNRFAQQPQQIIQPVFERVIDPRPIPVGSYRRVEPQFRAMTRRIEPLYHEDRFASDFRSAEDDLIVRQREAVDHMDRLRLDDRRAIELPRKSDPRDSPERRNAEFDTRLFDRPNFPERRYNDAHPIESRGPRYETFGRGPSLGRGPPRDYSPPHRVFPRDSDPFAPIQLQRRYQDTDSELSSLGW